MVTSGTMTNRVDRLTARGLRRSGGAPRRPPRRARGADRRRGKAAVDADDGGPASRRSASLLLSTGPGLTRLSLFCRATAARSCCPSTAIPEHSSLTGEFGRDYPVKSPPGWGSSTAGRQPMTRAPTTGPVARRTARHSPSALSATLRSTASDSDVDQEGAGRARAGDQRPERAVFQTRLQ